MIKKLKEVRETSELELDEEEAEPTIGRNFKTKFEIPFEYSEKIMTIRQDQRDLYNSGHEFQIKTRSRLQQGVSERCVTI